MLAAHWPWRYKTGEERESVRREQGRAEYDRRRWALYRGFYTTSRTSSTSSCCSSCAARGGPGGWHQMVSNDVFGLPTADVFYLSDFGSAGRLKGRVDHQRRRAQTLTHGTPKESASTEP